MKSGMYLQSAFLTRIPYVFLGEMEILIEYRSYVLLYLDSLCLDYTL